LHLLIYLAVYYVAPDDVDHSLPIDFASCDFGDANDVDDGGAPFYDGSRDDGCDGYSRDGAALCLDVWGFWIFYLPSSFF
jgi:hypothetical protein